MVEEGGVELSGVQGSTVEHGEARWSMVEHVGEWWRIPVEHCGAWWSMVNGERWSTMVNS